MKDSQTTHNARKEGWWGCLRLYIKDCIKKANRKAMLLKTK